MMKVTRGKIMDHDELRKKLDILNDIERGEASRIVTECLKYIMDHIQPERSKREDSFEEFCEWGSKGKFGLIIEKEEMRCSEHYGNIVRDK